MKISLKKEGAKITPSSDEDYKIFNKISDGTYEVDLKKLDTRTPQQNKSLHLWCEQIAHTLNYNGLYMIGIFGNKIEWTMELVKAQIVKGTIKKVFNVNSTTSLKRKEIDEMIDYITIAFASKGVEIPEFPNREAIQE